MANLILRPFYAGVRFFFLRILGEQRTLKIIRWAAKGNEHLLDEEDLWWIKEPERLAELRKRGFHAYHLYGFDEKGGLKVISTTPPVDTFETESGGRLRRCLSLLLPSLRPQKVQTK